MMFEGMENTYFRMDVLDGIVSPSNSKDSSSACSVISVSCSFRGSVSLPGTCFIPSASPLEGKRISTHHARMGNGQKSEQDARIPTEETLRKKNFQLKCELRKPLTV